VSQRKIRNKKLGSRFDGKKDPVRGLFMQAESFYRSANLLFHHATQMGPFNPPYMFPSIVCEAFSLELYLKCLITKEGSEDFGTHDLEQLYGLVSAGNRARIEEIFNERYLPQEQRMAEIVHKQLKKSGECPKVTLQDYLHKSRRAFESFRYIHEKTKSMDGDGWSAKAVLQAVRERLIEIEPEWANFQFIQAPPVNPTLNLTKLATSPIR